MRQAGFVLVGGASSRMGRDKALLPYRGTTLVEHAAQTVLEAAGSVALIGSPERYGQLGYAVFADEFPGCGPIGGVYTALRSSKTPWNLVVACDMPEVSAEALRMLLARAAKSAAQCVVAAGPDDEPEPLCGVYHANCLPALDRAIRDKRFKMKDLLTELRTELVALSDPACLRNLNTPADWAEFETKVK